MSGRSMDKIERDAIKARLKEIPGLLGSCHALIAGVQDQIAVLRREQRELEAKLHRRGRV